MARATTAHIHLDALQHNMALLKAKAPQAKLMAVVKADGYGHGLERVALALRTADAFGVASISDARRLREAGLPQQIVLLSGFDEASDLEQLRELQLDTVVHHQSQLDMLGSDAGTPLRVWLKMDTGMHRLGFDPDAFKTAFAWLKSRANVHPDIVCMSHFAASEDQQGKVTQQQMLCFSETVAECPGAHSLSNSAAVLNWPSAHGQWLRAGGALYGLSLSPEPGSAAYGLQPAMTLSTRLISVKTVKKGERVGYSGMYQCPEDMTVGVAAVGYGDGYPRHVKQETPVLLNGLRVPIIGRVSMDLMTLDLRSQPDASVGDPVVLWGKGLPIEEIALAAETISYELTCSITRRVGFTEDALFTSG